MMTNIELHRRLLKRHRHMRDDLRAQISINQRGLPYDDGDKELSRAQLRHMAKFCIKNYGDLLKPRK